MLNQIEALERLNKEKDYEDGLSRDLAMYFISRLYELNDLTDEERQRIRANLTEIIIDTMKHSRMFNEMILQVLEDGDSI